MRFANISGTKPYHSIVDVPQDPIDRSDSGKISPYTISGETYAITAELSSSLDVSGSLNSKRLKQRQLYDKWLQGSASNSELGFIGDGNAISPSWTQKSIGLDCSYVVPTISSSDHESQILNAYRSGSVKLEDTLVAASGNSYYSKTSGRQIQHVIYKLSASNTLPLKTTHVSSASGTWAYPSVDEVGLRTISAASSYFLSVSGCFRSNSIFDPAVFEIEVTESGRIKDVRVWVEFIHDHRGGTGPTTSSDGVNNARFLASGLTGSLIRDYSHGLQSVVIALRSPNVYFPYAHPLWNAPAVRDFSKRTIVPYSTVTEGVFWERDYETDTPLSTEDNDLNDELLVDEFKKIPEIFKNSYLLWSGHAAEYDLYNVHDSFTSPQNMGRYREFDTDIDMRTIFTDSSRNLNPRNLTKFFTSHTNDSPGVGLGIFNMSGSTGLNSTYGLSYKYPSKTVFELFYDDAALLDVTGANFPWMLDSRIPPGNFLARDYTNLLDGTTTSSYNVPDGWLTGPNRTADTNEFTTFGMQLGPNDINAVYPLLDDVFVQKKSNIPIERTAGGYTFPEIIDPYFSPNTIGFRPGLRGTEARGKWILMIGMTADFLIGKGMIVKHRGGIWFRQFRLEFILEQGEDVNFNPQSRRRYRKPNTVSGPAGKRLIQIMSGSSEWDRGVNYVYAYQPDEYGRTIGITDKTGSNLNDFAVFTRLTGALADRLTGSGQAALNAYLNNEFGTPYIPISSGSGVDSSFFVFESIDQSRAQLLIKETLGQKPYLKQSHTLQSVLNRNRYLKDTLARREEILIGLNILEQKAIATGSF